MIILTDIPKQCKRAHKYDAGYDILSSIDTVIPPKDKAIINTGLVVYIPQGCVGILKSRSGLAVKHDIEVGAGVIDYGYTGEVKVVLRNFGNERFIVNTGDKIAQLAVVPLYQDPDNYLLDDDRGTNGFNSTGYKHE